MIKFLIIFSQYNNSKRTITAIDSIKRCDKENIQINFLIADDCSTDRKDIINFENYCKNKKYIFFEKNYKNFGYFKSLSFNLKKKIVEDYDYVWIGNNDIFNFSKNYFTQVAKTFASDRNIAACSSTVKNEEGKQCFFVKKKYFLDKKELSDVGFLVRVSDLSKIGYLSDNFNYEFCDVNFESEVKKAGLKCAYLPDIYFTHMSTSESRQIYKSKKNTISRFKDFIILYRLENKILSLSFFFSLLRELKIFYKKNKKLLIHAIIGIYFGFLKKLN